MSQDECSICLCLLSELPTHELKCKHIFHLKCIQSYFESSRNRYDYATGRRIYPTCPLCRARIRAEDIPLRPRVRYPIVDSSEPAYSAMNPEERPQRLARTSLILQREETLRLIDRLVAQRRQIVQDIQGDLTVSDNLTARQTVTVEESRRSRSPSSQPPSQDDRPLSQTRSDLQEVQMQLGIFQNQIESLNTIQEAGEEAEEDDEEEDLEEFELGDDSEVEIIEPVEVVGRIGTGRGPHTRYRVRWSDGSMTFNKANEVKRIAPALLARWQRANATQNNRNSREKLRLARNQ